MQGSSATHDVNLELVNYCPINFWHANQNGLPLTRDDLTASYAIIRHNVRTYRSGGVVAVVGGRHNAELELKKFEDSQDPSDRHEGWRYFVEKSDLMPGIDPAKATQQREADLEKRESKAMPPTESPFFGPK